MSKLIAVWGPPGSGKTTFSVKLGIGLHDDHGQSVYTVFTDNTTPALPVLFANKKSDELYSVGAALAKADTTQRDIELNTVTVKHLQNIGYLGYKDGENRFTYPQAYEFKCAEFLSVLKDLADIVIVDCTSVPDILSTVAMANADLVIRIVAPDPKSIAFCSSQLPIMKNDPQFQCDEHMIIVNVNTNDVFPAVYDTAHYFGKDIPVMPYSPTVRLQSFNGELTERGTDKKYSTQLNAILSKIMERFKPPVEEDSALDPDEDEDEDPDEESEEEPEDPPT